MTKGTFIYNGKDYSNGGGGGVSFITGNELLLEDNVLNYKANYGTTEDFETFKQDSDVPIGATYHVTDDYIEGGGSSETYDDTERVIGTWFGKPLYRKCFILTNTYNFQNGTWTDIQEITFPTPINITRSEMLWRHSTSGNTVCYPMLATLISVVDNATLRLMSLRSNSHSSVIGDIVTLEYTKVGD